MLHLRCLTHVLNTPMNGNDIRRQSEKIKLFVISISAKCSPELRDQNLRKDSPCIKG